MLITTPKNNRFRDHCVRTDHSRFHEGNNRFRRQIKRSQNQAILQSIEQELAEFREEQALLLEYKVKQSQLDALEILHGPFWLHWQAREKLQDRLDDILFNLGINSIEEFLGFVSPKTHGDILWDRIQQAYELANTLPFDDNYMKRLSLDGKDWHRMYHGEWDLSPVDPVEDALDPNDVIPCDPTNPNDYLDYDPDDFHFGSF